MRKLIFFLFVIFAPAAFAQSPLNVNPDKNKPIEITAVRTIEWHRNDQKYIARGDALARQGDVSVAGETLTADYRGGEGDGSSTQIWRFTAEGNVTVQNASNAAYGDIAVYDIDKGLATMTGSNLRLTSPGQVITADERFEYWAAQGRANAIGNAIVERGDDKLRSNKMTALFKEGPGGEQIFDQIEAVGNVIITTPTEVLTGDYGIYKSSTNIAEITGNVKITRGPNILQGTRAQVNLSTNVSKMFGSPAGETRVRGVFYPDSQNGN